ncbi:MAG: type II 3-dehydroquinate dehydratase [Bacteroidia bacterium]
MKKIGIINGPNLNLLGKREPEIYGDKSFEEFFDELKSQFKEKTELVYFQSNIEGELINKIQEWGFELDGILLNAGGYSHTSIAIADAVKSIKTPVIGIHISNIYNRETPRHSDLLLGACKGNISGLGLGGYELGVRYLLEK